MKKFDWIFGFKSNFKSHYGKESISDAFLNTMESRLQVDFLNKTGIDINKSSGIIGLSMSPCDIFHPTPELKPDEVKAVIVIDCYGTNVQIKWRTLSGIEVTPNTEIFDQNDLIIWFENFNIEKTLRYLLQIKPGAVKKILPKTKFKLKLDYILWGGVILIAELKEINPINVKLVENSFMAVISKWNNECETSSEHFGCVKKYRLIKTKENLLFFYIDFGDSNFKILANLILELDKLNLLELVKIRNPPVGASLPPSNSSSI